MMSYISWKLKKILIKPQYTFCHSAVLMVFVPLPGLFSKVNEKRKFIKFDFYFWLGALSYSISCLKIIKIVHCLGCRGVLCDRGYICHGVEPVWPEDNPGHQLSDQSLGDGFWEHTETFVFPGVLLQLGEQWAVPTRLWVWEYRSGKFLRSWVSREEPYNHAFF